MNYGLLIFGALALVAGAVIGWFTGYGMGRRDGFMSGYSRCEFKWAGRQHRERDTSGRFKKA